MNPNSHISYLIEVHLEVSATNESAQESSFSAEYTLTPVENSTYSAEIREGQALFEISMDSICMNLDKSVTKSVDFLRRSTYRYDGVQSDVGDMGDIKIMNRQMLSKQWATIHSLVQADYKGFFVDDYLMKISNMMESLETCNMPMNNYFYYGLILFGVPLETSIGWSKDRNIILSDFDDVPFEENLKCELKENGKQGFSITGKILNQDDDYQVNKFYGRTLFPIGSFFPDWTQLEVDYRKGDINVYWKYELTRQEE